MWRRLYGYRQKVGKKVYTTDGILKQLDSHKLSNGVFLVPFQNRQKMIDFLDKNKITYEMIELYKKSDEK